MRLTFLAILAAGLAGNATRGDSLGYGPAGLEAEIDCGGLRHAFGPRRTVDLKEGTALAGHRHPREAGAPPLGEIPAIRYEYDPNGRVIQSSKE